MSFSSAAPQATSQPSSGTGQPSATIVDANTIIDGSLSTSHDLRIDGRVTGTLMCNGVLHVAEGAEVDATVEASSIIVGGTLSGEITCHGRLEIRSTGTVRGRVETGRLIVVEGAVYEGQLRMDAPVPDPAQEADSDAESTMVEVEPEPAGQSTGSYSFLRSFAPGGAPSRSEEDDLPGSQDDEDPN